MSQLQIDIIDWLMIAFLGLGVLMSAAACGCWLIWMWRHR
jgi:hypothetical protein